MQFKLFLLSLMTGLFSMADLQAQSLQPETMPLPAAHQPLVETIPFIPYYSLREQKPMEDMVSLRAKEGEHVVQTALQYLGARYRLGSTGPKVFDCSGFTGYIFRQRNVSLLRTSRSQYTQGTAIKNIADLKKGDLVFFGGRSNRRTVGHVGIVSDVDASAGKFSFVHASIHGVKVSDSDERYYKTRYIGARRVLEN